MATKHELETEHRALSVLVYVLDCTDAEQVEKVFTQVDEKVGRIDILINNAGYLTDFASVRDINVDEWWKGFVRCSPVSISF